MAIQEVPCPVTGTPTRVHLSDNTNRMGGWDTDGAWYSSAEQYRAWALATCPDSPLTLLGNDLAMGLTARQQHLLSPVLAALTADGIQPAELPVYQRYRIAADCYRALGRSRWFLARLYLQGAWVVRDQAVGRHLGIQGPRDAHHRMAELREQIADTDTPELRLALAQLAHRSGRGRERDAQLEALEGSPKLPPAIREGVRLLRWAADDAEAGLLDDAIAELTAFVEAPDEGSRHARLQATFVLADLHRRRGNPVLALTLYQIVAQDPGAVAELAALAGVLAAEVQGNEPFDKRPAGPLTPPRVALP